MASTGIAAKLLGDKTKTASTTVHKSLFQEDKINIKKTGIFQSTFKNKSNADKKAIFYIIDESSMIGNTPLNRIEENERHLVFSDEMLLKSIITGLCHGKNKVIFVGDPCQLPPVREKRNEVPALDGKYIYEKFQLESMEFVLTDIFRQNKNSEIVKNSMILRQYIDENINPTQFNLTYKKNEIERIYGENFIDLYLQNKENSIVITKTNIRALYLSKKIRKTMKLSNILSINEKLLVIKNNYNFNKMNGEVVTILSLEDKISKIERVTIGTKTVELKIINAVISINNTSTKVGILLNYLEDKTYPKSANIIESAITKIASLSLSSKSIENFTEDLLKEKLRFLSSHIKKEISDKYSGIAHKDFDISAFIKYIDGITISKEIRQEVLEYYQEECVRKVDRDNVFYRALCVRYGYAVTCHKAQGGEHDIVFMDEIIPRDTKDMRWLYTAITRAREKLYVIKNIFLNTELKDHYYDRGYVIEDIELIRIKDITGVDESRGNTQNYPYFKWSSKQICSSNEVTRKWLTKLLIKLKGCDLSDFRNIENAFYGIKVSRVIEEKYLEDNRIQSIFQTFTTSYNGINTLEEITFTFSLSEDLKLLYIESNQDNVKNSKGEILKKNMEEKTYYYASGEKRVQCSYFNGKLAGEVMEFFKNGKIRRNLNFLEGAITHPIKNFTKKGQEYKKCYIIGMEINKKGLDSDTVNSNLPIVIDFSNLIQNLKKELEERLVEFDLENYIRREIISERMETQGEFVDEQIDVNSSEGDSDNSLNDEIEDNLYNYLLNLSEDFINFFITYGKARKYRIINLEEKYFLILKEAIEMNFSEEEKALSKIDLKLIEKIDYFFEIDEEKYPIKEVMKDEILLKIVYLKEKREREKLKKQEEFEIEDFDFSNL